VSGSGRLTTAAADAGQDPAKTADYFFNVKPHIKISCALAAIALVGFWFSSVHTEKKCTDCETITLTGMISPDTFLAFQDRLVRSSAKNKTFVVTESGGGSWESALALGILIHRHGWNVEVVDICASSCANFIFPAGKVKYLHGNALLLFHGGPHQQNLLTKVIDAEHASVVKSAPAKAEDPDHARMEGAVIIDDKGPQRLKVLEFLSIKGVSNATDFVTRLTNASDRFYEELGVNVLLPTYGQIGSYETIYKSYKYGGFIYRLDSLRRLGIGNIELKEGEWRPERHRDYHDVYEVTYP
jgi:hypothetical protein